MTCSTIWRYHSQHGELTVTCSTIWCYHSQHGDSYGHVVVVVASTLRVLAIGAHAPLVVVVPHGAGSHATLFFFQN